MSNKALREAFVAGCAEGYGTKPAPWMVARAEELYPKKTEERPRIVQAGARKRTLWLARSVGLDSTKLYSKRPKRIKTKAYKCECGDPKCNYNEPPGYVYEGDTIESYCHDGLQEQGLDLQPGELVKVTLEPVR